MLLVFSPEQALKLGLLCYQDLKHQLQQRLQGVMMGLQPLEAKAFILEAKSMP